MLDTNYKAELCKNSAVLDYFWSSTTFLKDAAYFIHSEKFANEI